MTNHYKFCNLGFADLSVALSCEQDLAAVERAVVRERAIRQTMAETGEARAVVVETIDAALSMDQESVLELTEGAPTTLADALARYVRLLPEAVTGMTGEISDQIASDLSAILEYPWPAEEALVALHQPEGVALHIEEGDDRDLEIRIGPNRWLVCTVNWEDAGSGGQRAAEEVARAIHRAVLARVIADRPHHVQLNDAERRDLIGFLERPNGSWTGGGRLSVDAVSGGGVIVRTRPYTYQRPGHALAKEQAERRPCGNDGPRDLGYERPDGPGATDSADVPDGGRTDG